MKVELLNPSDQEYWDGYVREHPLSTHCHLAAWGEVMKRAYGHKAYYLLAEGSGGVKGVLPLIHVKGPFGNSLISLPFLNYGGILASGEEVERALWQRAKEIARDLGADYLELRHHRPLSLGGDLAVKTHKVRMILPLPSTSEELFRSFRSKLRSQIRRPAKEGMRAELGGAELLDAFYKVFSVNMRDLGSPVHSKKFFTEIFRHFSDRARIGIVLYEDQAVAAGIVIGFRDTLEIPWASSLRRFNRYSPNMLLYWSFLAYGCDSGYRFFDFGRSTPGEGTYRFKAQWGARPEQLFWYYWSKNGRGFLENEGRFSLAVRCWKSLPVPITRLIGPRIRRYIPL